MSTLAIVCVEDPGRAARLIPADARTIPLGELRARGPAAALAALREQRFDRCLLVVGELRLPSAWLALHGLALAARARRRTAVTPGGDEMELTWAGLLGRELPFALRRARRTRRVVSDVRKLAAELRPAPAPRAVVPRRVLFVRSDLGPPLTGGGSHAHVLGVAGGLVHRGISVALTSPAPVSGVEACGVEQQIVPADESFQVSVELPHLAYNATLLPQLDGLLRTRGYDVVYARHALGSFAAALAAQRHGVPLVVEFNGPEVWIARHWGAAREYLELFDSLERAVLRAADVVLAVSRPLVAVLREMGVDERRILVDPNGVDPAAFDPSRHVQQRAAVRRELGLGVRDVLVGFVGTFGPWHGAPVLARAAAKTGSANGLAYLFVGDGGERALCEELVREAGPAVRARFTGMVPAAEVPGLVAACDVCVSPHVPNRDGSPFFGSPTKLFEYMAAGRAILASRLDQLGEVLEHDRNARLVPPGDVDALAAALLDLAADPALRERLGNAAAEDARSRHSWDAHVDRLLARLATTRGAT